MDKQKKSPKKEGKKKPPEESPKKKSFEQVIYGKRFKDHPLVVIIA